MPYTVYDMPSMLSGLFIRLGLLITKVIVDKETQIQAVIDLQILRQFCKFTGKSGFCWHVFLSSCFDRS